jgi:hypothetical protein
MNRVRPMVMPRMGIRRKAYQHQRRADENAH